MLLTRPAAAWVGPTGGDPSFWIVSAVGVPVLIGSVVVAATHVWLAVRFAALCPCGQPGAAR